MVLLKPGAFSSTGFYCKRLVNLLAVLIQILCLAEGIRFSENCEEAIKKGRLRELFSEVEGQLDFYTNVDLGGATEVEAVVLELKLKALILDTIHSMDVVQQLMEANIRATTQWQWQKQLRSRVWQCFKDSWGRQFSFWT